MNFKRVIAGIMAFCLMGAIMPSVGGKTADNAVITANAYTEGTYEQLTYKNYSEYIEITDCDESATSVVIPAEIDGVPVTSIGYSAFKNCKSLTEIVIPDSVTDIGEYAFFLCTNLTSITLPKGIASIGCYAFDTCLSLTAITIPDSVTSIDYGAFWGCESLTSITIPGNVTSIDYGTFKDCLSLISIIIPEGVTSIGNEAFRNCPSLTSITIPDSVVSIGEFAFYQCSDLTSINIPDSVTSIGYNAFYGCSSLSLKTNNTDVICDTKLRESNILMINYPRPKLNYNTTEPGTNKSNIAKSKSVEADINYGTISNNTSWEFTTEVGRLQECKDSKGNIYAIYGGKNSITLFFENTDTNPVIIENDGFTFGAATIDENDNLYVFWGYSISEDIIEEEIEKNTENLVVMKYDLRGNTLGRCGISITTSMAQYPFDAGNASMAVKDNVIGCFFNTEWTKSYFGDECNHQGSEFAAIDKNTMELIEFSNWEGSHSFGVSLIPTDYGFAGIQKGDAYGRGINFNTYLVADNEVETDYLTWNGNKPLFNASGQYGVNNTYLHMGGLAKSATTYAVVGKSERIYSSMSGYGNSDLRTNNYDVFLKITDQTLAQTASDLVGEERVDVETGKTANYNVVWLTECNETEKAGQCKVVTLADGSYCVLWEKFVNDKFDSIRYVVTDECGNILRHETGIYGARLSDTSVQPIVDEYTLKWAVADAENKCINFYTVDLNEFSETPIKDVFGDANCDGKVTIADSTAILQSLGNPDKYGLSEQGAINADCCNHGDGVMTSDALAIQMVDAGMLKQEQLPIAKLPDIKN